MRRAPLPQMRQENSSKSTDSAEKEKGKAVTQKSNAKKRARALQERTGWPYMKCLRAVSELTDGGVEALIKIEASATARPQPEPKT